MDLRDLGGREVVIDVDTSSEGESSIACNNDKIMPVQRDGTSNFSRGFPNSTGITPLSDQEEMGLVVGDKNKTDKSDRENPNNNNNNNKNHKMPSKPPRPPKALSLDASEAKLVREISELAMLKRARMERMKALKKMKNAKTSSSSSIWPMIITVLFCVVLFWQGLFSGNSSNLRFEGSPVSSVGNGGLISVEYYNNCSGDKSNNSSSSIVKQISGSDETIAVAK